MLKRSLPPTPTYSLSFDYCIREAASERASLSPIRSTFPNYSSPSSSSNNNNSSCRDAGSPFHPGAAATPQRQHDTQVPRKRRRSSIVIMMNNHTDTQDDEDAAMQASSFQSHATRHTEIRAADQHNATSVSLQPAIADKDVAGPSRLAPFLVQGEKSSMSSRLGNAPSSLGSRMKKKPAKLALASPPKPATDLLQVHEMSLGSRSVPSSPMVYSRATADASTMDTDDGREQLRDSLRGTPRRRPSVPFGLRMVKLPSLTIPPKSARLSQEGPPPIWQDPSEHILSGDGSSLQHARSVYASGPIEVLPGLFLGDEFNACDDAGLARLGITTIINVAKETTLPFQSDSASEQLDAAPSAGLHRGMQKVSLNGSSVGTPTSASSAARRQTPGRERFFTPLTSMHPEAIFLSPPPPPRMPGSMTPSRSLYLRDISSTPNLLSQYDVPGSARRSPDASSSPESSSSVDSAPSSPEMGTTPSLHLSHRYSSTNLSTTTPSSNGAETAATSATSSSSAQPSIMLPSNAVALNVAPSPQTGRPQSLRYIKLPWTHDETDLAGARPGGFITGCALIAAALGIDMASGRYSRVSNDDRKEGVLVHCQCGVSRSATLVIAFVMQAAAHGYDFDKTQALTGMHDCYEMVKELSSSISPNCSLIYQLVEWERQLSTSRGEGYAAESHGDPSALSGDRKWGNEALNEEDWTKMRLDEEAKEREEEEKTRSERLEAAKAMASQEKSKREEANASYQPSSSLNPDAPFATGLGARRKRPTPSLNLASSAKSASVNAGGNGQDAKGVASRSLPAAQVVAVNEAPVEEEKHLAPTSNGAVRRVRLISPSLTSIGSPLSGGSNGSGTSTLLAPAAHPPHHPFGVAGQTAAERRNKHKRTFSKELPGWNRSSTSNLVVTAPSDE